MSGPPNDGVARPATDDERQAFEEDLVADLELERSLPWRELAAFGVVVVIAVLHRLG